MADYSMDDEGWEKRKVKVNTYLEGHPDLGEMATVIQWNLNSGDEQPENRKRFWTNITTLFGMLPDSPISRGRESDLPEEIQQAITTASVTYADCFAAAYATDPLFGEIVRKHGKSGGGTYAGESAYHAYLKQQMKGRLTGYYRNSLKGVTTAPTWDGSENNGIPVIVTPVTEEDDSSEEE
jgi:hypothetical protein